MAKSIPHPVASYVDVAGARRTIGLRPGGLLLDVGPGGARCLAELGPDDGPRQVEALVAEYLRAPRPCRLAGAGTAAGEREEAGDGSLAR